MTFLAGAAAFSALGRRAAEGDAGDGYLHPGLPRPGIARLSPRSVRD